ncbi:diacylglyceryl transferase [Leptolyngbya sp. 'hensonii']|uniref:prolipoprotein diacylglyceryl transferase n=1 Tax=Leptolyngbya sp. 'hensonii' TaxID=1922337 RepID=UPI00094FDE97|nr:prolipoprotein diacylglyceryl transferase family protein [Leptolyngbya sp. 'hensonii']OLP15848.1 diacylglyceryl transferase [Leptolyngbya sp. 'hensonii']
MDFPVYLPLGPWKVHPHLLFEILAYSTALHLALAQFRRDSIAPNHRSSVIVGGLVGGLIGAKVLVVLQHLDLLWQDWPQLVLVFLYGKTVVGALLGALIGVELTKRWIGVQQSTGDAFVYPLLAGMVIGRIGCFLTGLDDRTHGMATHLPWGMDFGDGVLRHPTQLYEIGFLLLLLIFLRTRDRQALRSGDLFKLYLSAYLGFRFLIDFIKPDFHPFFGLSAIQVACLAGILYYFRDFPRLWGWQRHDGTTRLDLR